MTTPTPLPLDAADHAYARNWARSTTDAEYHALAHAHAAGRATLAARVAELERELNGACKASATELRAVYKRVAELERELAETRASNASLVEMASHANALRDALEKVCALAQLHLGGEGMLWFGDADGNIEREARAALASTPAASLAAHRKSVLEKAAAMCEAKTHTDGWGEFFAQQIRTLAEKAQEVKP